MTMPLRLVSGSSQHIVDLAPRLRPIDCRECEAMGRTAEQALRHGLAASVQTWTALIDDKPQAMFGVVVESVANGCANPWFLGSEAVPRHARLLITLGPVLVAGMHRHARRLSNFVSSDNWQAIRLLQHWGFSVEHEEIFLRKLAFRRFIREIE